MWAAKVSAAGAATADWPPGQRVKFRLAGGSSAEGEVSSAVVARCWRSLTRARVQVVAHDSRAGVVVLKGEADAYTVVSLSCITDVIERLPPAAGFVPEARAAACARGWRSLRAAQPLPDHDAARAARRLDEALRAAETAAARIGEGVSRQAQTLFDAISKTCAAR
jgi:hypothetical protein